MNDISVRWAGSAMASPGLRRAYWRIVAGEVIAILIGVAGLGMSGRPGYRPAWVLLIVGAHFIPLGRLFGSSGLILSGAALIAVAAGAAAAGVAGAAPPSTIAGPAAAWSAWPTA
jgi:hypothetical protein